MANSRQMTRRGIATAGSRRGCPGARSPSSPPSNLSCESSPWRRSARGAKRRGIRAVTLAAYSARRGSTNSLSAVRAAVSPGCQWLAGFVPGNRRQQCELRQSSRFRPPRRRGVCCASLPAHQCRLLHERAPEGVNLVGRATAALIVAGSMSRRMKAVATGLRLPSPVHACSACMEAAHSGVPEICVAPWRPPVSAARRPWACLRHQWRARLLQRRLQRPQ